VARGGGGEAVVGDEGDGKGERAPSSSENATKATWMLTPQLSETPQPLRASFASASRLTSVERHLE